MDNLKNILFDKIIYFVDDNEKKLIKNKYFHNSIIKTYYYLKNENKKFLYKRDGIYNLNINDKTKINPLISGIELYNKKNEIIDGEYLLDTYRNNIPLWIILKNENLDVVKIKIIYFNNSEKIINCLNIKHKSLYEVVKN